MSMSFSVFYTPHAEETFKATYQFVSEKFGQGAALKFLTKAEKTIALIADHPFIFKPSLFDPNVRVALISKRCSLFYQLNENSIYLLFFWDNRQEDLHS